jgi:beta-galactosidase/beta-glucuronidase
LAGTAIRHTLDLNGSWEVRLDPDSSGEGQQWFSGKVPFTELIRVPGCWQAQGFGKRSGILRNDYSGPAWYRKAATILSAWRGRRVVLRIGGVLRITELFVNGERIGIHDGMSAPFSFDVTQSIHAGSKNLIAIKVTNLGKQPGDSPDKQAGNLPTGMLNYIGNWGGIYGPVAIEATAPVWVDEIAVRTQLADDTARFHVTLHNTGDRPVRGRLRAAVGRQTNSVPAEIAPGQSLETEVALRIPGARRWSPEDPHLYTAVISILCGNSECDRLEQRSGMRESTTQGNVLLLNGKPLYLRGNGDDNVEVISAVPPASKEIYLERLRRARSFGFNAVRFHSMTPVSVFFDVADEVGLLIMSELPVPYTQYLLPNKDFLCNELKSIILTHRNHPSWLSLAMGNEFNLRWDQARE